MMRAAIRWTRSSDMNSFCQSGFSCHAFMSLALRGAGRGGAAALLADAGQRRAREHDLDGPLAALAAGPGVAGHGASGEKDQGHARIPTRARVRYDPRMEEEEEPMGGEIQQLLKDVPEEILPQV